MKTIKLTVHKDDTEAFNSSCKDLGIEVLSLDDYEYLIGYVHDFTLFTLGQLTQIKSIKSKI